MRPWLAIVSALGLAGCLSRSPSRCDRVCRREEDCAHELNLENDVAECVDACGNLEREPALQATVDRHVKCVDEAQDCETVLECE